MTSFSHRTSHIIRQEFNLGYFVRLATKRFHATNWLRAVGKVYIGITQFNHYCYN